MIRLLLVITIMLFVFWGYSQAGNKILRFEVKSSLLKIPLENGSLSEWRSFGDIDETMQTNIVFDLTKMKIYFDVKAKNNDKNFEGGIRVYEINKIIRDTNYVDFGFTCFKLSCTDEKKKIVNYELLEFDLDDCQHFYLIDNSKKFKSKEELIPK
jgi:hypothetical protein